MRRITRSRIAGFLAQSARDPLVHLLAAGVLCFAAYQWLGPESGERRIVVSSDTVDGLRREHRARTGDDATPQELRVLVTDWVHQEALVREAIALGLHEGDPIVRRRLVQKMQVLSEDLSRDAEPTDAELLEYVRRHPARYGAVVHVDFDHVFVRGNGPDSEARARSLLAELKAGADPRESGDPFLRGRKMRSKRLADVEATFGKPFAEAVERLPSGRWSGPVASSFGRHLVLVHGREANQPALDAIRERARLDWRSDRRAAAARKRMEAIQERYEVVIEDDDAERAEYEGRAQR